MKKNIVLLFILVTGSCFGQMLEVRRGLDKIEQKVEVAADAPKTDQNVKGIGDYTFNGTRLIPNIKILANRTNRPNGSTWYNAGELFILQNPNPKSLEEYRVNFLIPEFSAYGVNYTLGWCNKDAAEYDDAFLGIILNAGFLGRDFKRSVDTVSFEKDFSTTNALLNIGLEWVLPERFISLYGSYNLNSVLTNRETFQESFQTRRRDFNYLTAGIRTELDLLENTSTLALDLGFIFQSSQVSGFIGNKDLVIPQIRIGFRQSFLSK